MLNRTFEDYNVYVKQKSIERANVDKIIEIIETLKMFEIRLLNH